MMLAAAHEPSFDAGQELPASKKSGRDVRGVGFAITLLACGRRNQLSELRRIVW